MNKVILATLALALAPAALACPVKAGKISNGAMSIPGGLKAECGQLYNFYVKNAKSEDGGAIKWLELYKTAPGRNKAVSNQLENYYKGQGFTLYSRDRDSEGEQIFYINKRYKKIVGFQVLNIEGESYLGIAGN